MIYIQINGIITECETIMDINIRIIKATQPSMEDWEIHELKDMVSKKLKK